MGERTERHHSPRGCSSFSFTTASIAALSVFRHFAILSMMRAETHLSPIVIFKKDNSDSPTFLMNVFLSMLHLVSSSGRLPAFGLLFSGAAFCGTSVSQSEAINDFSSLLKYASLLLKLSYNCCFSVAGSLKFFAVSSACLLMLAMSPKTFHVEVFSLFAMYRRDFPSARSRYAIMALWLSSSSLLSLLVIFFSSNPKNPKSFS